MHVHKGTLLQTYAHLFLPDFLIHRLKDNKQDNDSIKDNKEYVAVVYVITKKETIHFLGFSWTKTVTYYTYTEPDRGSSFYNNYTITTKW